MSYASNDEIRGVLIQAGHERVLLPNGLGLNIDDANIGRVPFVRCLPNGCVAEVVLDPLDVLEALHRFQPDLVLEGYYDEENAGAMLMGESDVGSVVEYSPVNEQADGPIQALTALQGGLYLLPYSAAGLFGAGLVAAAGVVAAAQARGRPPCAAAGLGAAGAGVLQRQPGQARGLHLPDAAGAGGGRGAVVARAAAPTRSARDAVGLHGGAGGGGRRIGRVAAGGAA